MNRGYIKGTPYVGKAFASKRNTAAVSSHNALYLEQLMLHRAGEIELPPARFRPPNPLAERPRPASILIDRTPMEGPLKPLLPIRLEQVRRTADEVLFNSLIEDHHYLGYEQPVGPVTFCPTSLTA